MNEKFPAQNQHRDFKVTHIENFWGSINTRTTLFPAVGNGSKRRQGSQCLNHGNWRWIEEKEMNTIIESSTVPRPFHESVKESNASQVKRFFEVSTRVVGVSVYQIRRHYQPRG